MAPFARIVARYALGFLLAKAMYYGILDESLSAQIAADPQIATLVEGAVVATAAGMVETWYFFARKFGWAK